MARNKWGHAISTQDSGRRTKVKWTLSLLALALLAGTMTALLMGSLKSKAPVQTTAVPPVGVARTNLALVAGRLCLSGKTNAFTGLMVEHSADGLLRSRSAVTNGLLHGLSEGWHTNGQLQVTENFKEGVSHGLRSKWHPSGVKLSEGGIVDGKFHGTFRRWRENGSLAEQVEFIHGQPDGLALAYFESGFLKTRARMKDGKVVEQKTWKDGESNERMAQLPTPVASAKNNGPGH